MRAALTCAAIAAVAALLVLWGAGGFDRIAVFAAEQQRGFQNSIAGALRGVRAGQPQAVGTLLFACFAYGLAHAAGPGHGKVLIGGYGMAQGVSAQRLTTIALAASLGQAVTAVALVYAGVLLLNLGREAMIGLTEAIMAPVSYAAIGAIGLWLIWRGVRHLRPVPLAQDHPSDTCQSCGHAHGPTLDQMRRANSLRAALLLIASIAVRPCTGALFVLVITWQMGIAGAGIAGAFVMALGTAAITIAVGLGAGVLRNGMLAGFGGSQRAATLGAVIEIAAGALVALLAAGLLLRAV